MTRFQRLARSVLLYRLIAPFIGLIIALRGIWAVLRGSETMADLRERLLGPKIAGPAIWIHGASVGEMNAAHPVISALANDGPVLVTATTTTGRMTVKNWGLPHVHATLAPLDTRRITRRLIKRCKIKRLIIIENELWPNRIITCHAQGVPVQMINARMSASSARAWNKFPKLAEHVLNPMQLVAPQDDASADRLKKLGVKADRITDAINLKGAYAPNLSAIPALFNAFKRNETFLAAATHEGEEAIVLQAFAQLRKTQPHLKLIIAPRHPVRGEAIANDISTAGFSVAYRSSDDAPDADVYLADTLGEMHIWYRLAGVAFIGGSLVPKGGHTPFEPAAYDCPILHGPHVANFADAYAALAQADAAIPMSDAPSLAAAVSKHMGDAAMAARAKSALNTPDIAPLIAKIRGDTPS